MKIFIWLILIFIFQTLPAAYSIQKATTKAQNSADVKEFSQENSKVKSNKDHANVKNNTSVFCNGPRMMKSQQSTTKQAPDKK